MNQGIYFGQLVIGPAGSGKSTFCKHMQQMAETLHRNIVVVNLDPAAEHSDYKCDIDIQQLITLDDAMQQLQLGPNGALLFCIEYLIQNQQWLLKQLSEVVRQDDYVIFDCPGQIQLFSDRAIFRQIVKFLQQFGFSLVSMYMIDVNFVSDLDKYASGILQALSSQIALQLPSITVLTKCDLLQSQQSQQSLQSSLAFFTSNQQYLESQPQSQRFDPNQSLPHAVRKILNQNALVSIRSLNLEDEDSVRNLLWEADYAIQYGQNLQPNQKMYQETQKNMGLL